LSGIAVANAVTQKHFLGTEVTKSSSGAPVRRLERPLLEVHDLHKSFGTLEVLKGVSLAAHPGDVISMIGSSGSGKSTFLRCLNFLETPDSGRIVFDGEEVCLPPANKGRLDQAQVQRIRKNLGMVFQQFNLWSHMTVLENVMEAPVHVLHRDKREVLAEAMEVLSRVGIADKCNSYPSQISGGQQQRAAIARALCMRPRALLFDEPTSSLDPELVSEVLNVMRNLAKEGRTMIVVTHEMSFARDVSSEVLFLHNGAVEERGSADAIFSNPTTERCQKFLAEYRARTK